MTKTIALLLILAGPAAADELPRALHSSVVKIYATAQKPNWYQPWQRQYQEPSTGSGVIIDGRRILTNAHVVSDQIYLEARRAGDPARYPARVEFVGHDTELAVLKVDDPAFWEGAKPIPLGRSPRQRERMAVYGFPTGGDELSVTEGTVSRIELTPYAHTGFTLLTVQTDAAINPGNSGGPAIVDGKIAGVSFQSHSGSQVENIGYAVPVDLIRRFLADAADGRYDGVPRFAASLAKMENPALRRYYKLPEGASGALVSRVNPGYAEGELREGDVILAVDGREVANDLTYRHGENERLQLFHLFHLRQVGEKARLRLWREGKVVESDLTMRSWQDLVTGPHYDRKPSYLIYAGLVFTPLTSNYLGHWPPEAQHLPFRHLQDYGLPAKQGDEAVVLSHILPHAVSAGFSDLSNMALDRVNGVPVRRMADLARALKAPKDGFQVFEFDRDTTAASRVVLDAAAADAAHPGILERSGIAADRSDDLKNAP